MTGRWLQFLQNAVVTGMSSQVQQQQHLRVKWTGT